jgi:hypothetical protein
MIYHHLMAPTVRPARRHLAWPPRDAGLTSHKNITHPLCTLSGPTIRFKPDSKMVTECAKCARHPECARPRGACPRFAARANPPDHDVRAEISTSPIPCPWPVITTSPLPGHLRAGMGRGTQAPGPRHPDKCETPDPRNSKQIVRRARGSGPRHARDGQLAVKTDTYITR